MIELVNPDAGPAVADITLLGPHLFSTGRLRGILIPGHKTITVDLGTVIPRRTLFTAHVVVSRGRLAVDVLDSVTDLVTHRTTREWLPRQLAPATTNQLLGLPAGRRSAHPPAGQPERQRRPGPDQGGHRGHQLHAERPGAGLGAAGGDRPGAAERRARQGAGRRRARGLRRGRRAAHRLAGHHPRQGPGDHRPCRGREGRGRDPAPGRDGAGREAEPRSRRGCSCRPTRPARPG